MHSVKGTRSVVGFVLGRENHHTVVFPSHDPPPRYMAQDCLEGGGVTSVVEGPPKTPSPRVATPLNYTTL